MKRVNSRACFPSHLLNLNFENHISELNTVETWDVNYIWYVIPKTTPQIIRKCSRCNQDRFYSSDKFRINAHKKCIDVWLIYKCVQCDATLNVSIITRTTVSKIEHELLQRFQDNDSALCWQYAFDASLFQKGLKIDWDIELAVQEQLIKDPMTYSSSYYTMMVRSSYHLKIPIFLILRTQIKASRSQLEKLEMSEALKIYSFKGDLLNLKTNLGKGCVFKLSKTVEIASSLI